MDHKHPIADRADSGNRGIVYVRPVDMKDLPEDIRARAKGVEDLYALHDAQGQRLALVRGRKLAFVLARQNDMTPVSVH